MQSFNLKIFNLQLATQNLELQKIIASFQLPQGFQFLLHAL